MTLSLNLTTLPFVGGCSLSTRRLQRYKVLVIGDAQTAKGAPFFKHNHAACWGFGGGAPWGFH